MAGALIHRRRKMFYTVGAKHILNQSDASIAFMPIMLCKAQPACKAC